MVGAAGERPYAELWTATSSGATAASKRVLITSSSIDASSSAPAHLSLCTFSRAQLTRQRRAEQAEQVGEVHRACAMRLRRSAWVSRSARSQCPHAQQPFEQW